MTYIRALFAIFVGLRICFTEPAVRRLSMWPWIVGAVCHLASIVAAWHYHPQVVLWLTGVPAGFFGWLLHGMAWIGAAVILFAASLILSVIFVMLFTSIFQSSIALEVLKGTGAKTPEQPGGVSGTLKEAGRSIAVESAKLIWLLPVLAAVFLLGFIPLLLPFAVIGGAWLLAYQFADVILDLYRVPTFARLRFALTHKLLFICFGLSLTLLWSIPLAGMLLPPAATAGAAWLFSRNELLPGQKDGVVENVS